MTELSDGQLHDFAALMQLLGAQTIEEASDAVRESTDFESWFAKEGDEIVLHIADTGWGLEFPMSVEAFWRGVQDLEAEALAWLEVED